MAEKKQIGGVTFWVAQYGLHMSIDGKEYRFNPTEVKVLIDLLDEHRVGIQSAQRPVQAKTTDNDVL